MRERMPECSIVDVLTDTEHWLHWTAAFGCHNMAVGGGSSRRSMASPQGSAKPLRSMLRHSRQWARKAASLSRPSLTGSRSRNNLCPCTRMLWSYSAARRLSTS
jgi:hypothetical protein